MKHIMKLCFHKDRRGLKEKINKKDMRQRQEFDVENKVTPLD